MNKNVEGSSGAADAGPVGAWWSDALWLAVILAVSLLARLPTLVNAEATFGSDEAVNALVIRHLLEHGDFTFHNWDTTYYGIVEGLLAIPFVALLGFVPLSFKLSAVAGFSSLVVATYFLGARLYGRGAGLLASALLALFSPQLILWSTLASGGYTLIVAWGTFTLFYFAGLQRRSAVASRQFFAFGAVLGFGLYMYELYVVYVALFALYAASASFGWRALRAPSSLARRAAWRRLPRQLGRLGLVLAGLVVGWSPTLAAIWSQHTGSKKPFYQLATPDQIRANVELLFRECVPAFFGVNPTGSPGLARWVGASFPLSGACGWLLIGVYLAFFVWAMVRQVRRSSSSSLDSGPDAESLLVLLVPLVALAFVLSPNPQNVLSNRYLLPWLSALPVLAAAGLVRLASRGSATRLAAVAAAAFLCLYPAIPIAREQQASGLLGPHLGLRRKAEPLVDVVQFLRARGVKGAYGGYWTAYKATFLAAEKVVVAPLDWNRYPPYHARVRELANVAYVLTQPRTPHESWLLDELARAGRVPEVHDIGPYRIYLSGDGMRLPWPAPPAQRVP